MYIHVAVTALLEYLNLPDVSSEFILRDVVCHNYLVFIAKP